MSKPKCKYCQKELDKKEAYSPTGKSPWFCNENEYQLFMQPKWDKKDFVDSMEVLIPLMWGMDKAGWLIIKKALLAWYDEFGKERIEAYIDAKVEYIGDALDRKYFEDDSKKAFYAVAIIRNSIREFMEHYIPQKKREEVVELDAFYMPSEVRYKPTKVRRAMKILENEGGD